MLNTERHKQAKIKGYQAFIDGKPKSDNYYASLGKFAQVYASIWDSGWETAKKNEQDK